jgi:hypothetical protein
MSRIFTAGNKILLLGSKDNESTSVLLFQYMQTFTPGIKDMTRQPTANIAGNAAQC